ncbi:tyrosine-type recombinase/integrase [uncultured Bosea sp.]|uniref:tyrosine-type recombinase/integrase n=1 Tax=uncultured Bosea sp. TaxID=211457 RepID=UPI00263A7067|nr:tyrosine-type recombinase/integrase [uncultured Bosea sp.]
MAGKIRNLLPRNGRYYARLTVPALLRPIVGKRELTEPLGADRTVAIRLLSSAIHRMQMELDQARDRVAALSPSAPSRRRPMSVRQMALAHFDRELQRDDTARSLPNGYDPAHEAKFRPTYYYALKRAASGGAEDDELAALIQWAVDEFANDGSPVPAKGTEEWRSLARMLAGVKAESIENQNRRDRGEADAPPKHPMLIPATELPSTTADPLRVRIISPDSAKALSVVLSAMMTEKQGKPGTVYEYEVAVRMFEEFLGEAKPAYRITRQDVLAYKNALLETPANYTKRFPDKTLPETIRLNKARKEPFPTLNATTINDKWLSRLSALLTWCVNNSVIPDNPAKGVRVDQSNRDPDDDRDYFRDADLQKIFAAPLFDPSPKLTEKRWALLIALYSGMRASEIAQLRLDSISEVRGVLAFAVEEKTKNKQSRRLVPVHRTLLALGLHDRIAQLRRNGTDRLFPDWFRDGQAMMQSAEGKKRAVNQPYSQFIPRWFNRTYLPKVGIHDQNKVFHSFRHTLKTALKLAGVPKSVRDEIAGQDDRSAGAGYEHETSLDVLKEALDRVAYDLPELKAT